MLELKMAKIIKFGTDGWRGVVGKDFNLDNVAAVAQAIADYLLRTTHDPVKLRHGAGARRTTKVAVGYDTRRLSPEAARCISQVLTANRIKVILSNQPLPTQALSFTVRSQKCTIGIMVTASHNPPHFNGIKIKGAFGSTLETETTNKISQFIFKHKPQKASLTQARKKNLFKTADLVSGYLKFLSAYLDFSLLKKGRLNILVDPMHGTANSYIAKILKKTPCKVTTLHQDYDVTFGGVKPEPIQSCLRETIAFIRRKRFDLALVTDGDADRIAALDAHGRFISPQQIISLLLLHLIRFRKLKGAVVKTIAGTALLERIAKKYKLKVYETPVGFKHISHLMQKKRILIGGEEAGGIGFKNYIPERDGILAGLLLLETMIAQGQTLQGLLQKMQEEFGSFFYLRKDLRCAPENKEQTRKKLAKILLRRNFLGKKITKTKDYDGIKFYLEDESWILFRLSGTEPVLRIYAEADNLAKATKLVAEGARILKM